MRFFILLLVFVSCSSVTPDEVQNDTMSFISKDQAFTNAMNLNKPRMSKCYRDGIKGEYPDTKGSIVYDLSTGQFGGVIDAVLLSSDLGMPEVEECIRKTFLDLKFPQERNTDIKYTLRISTL